MEAKPYRHLPRYIRIVRARPRLFVSAIIGLIIIAALPADWRLATRMLIGWDVGALLYLAAVCETISRADIAHIRLRAAIEMKASSGFWRLRSLLHWRVSAPSSHCSERRSQTSRAVPLSCYWRC
jgi:hypothetical protein